MKLLRDARYLTSSVFVSLLLVAVRSFLILRILGPAANGAWKSAMLVYTLGEFTRIGVSRGLSVRVPIAEGRGDLATSNDTAETAGNFSLISGLLLGVATLLASLLTSHPDLQVSLLFVAFMVTVAQTGVFLEELVVARHRFEDRAKETLLEAVVGSVACVGLCWWIGLPGLGIGSILASGLSMWYLKRKLRFRFGLKVDWKKVYSLIRTGLPLTLAEMGFEVTRRLDILLMAVLLGPEMVGFYSLSLLTMDFAILLANRGVSQLVSPHLLREYGRTNSHHQVVTFYEIPARLFSYVLPLLLGIGAFLLPPLVGRALPDYLPGIAAAQVTVWSVFFVALHSSVAPFFIAAKRLPAVIRLFIVVILGAAVALAAVMSLGAGLATVAWTMFGVLGIATCAEFLLARHATGESPLEALKFLASLCLPLGLAMAAKLGVDFIPLPERWGAGMALAARLSLFVFLYAPLLLWFESRYSLLRAILHGSSGLDQTAPDSSHLAATLSLAGGSEIRSEAPEASLALLPGVLSPPVVFPESSQYRKN